jgi:hypothetical protein
MQHDEDRKLYENLLFSDDFQPVRVQEGKALFVVVGFGLDRLDIGLGLFLVHFSMRHAYLSYFWLIL